LTQLMARSIETLQGGWSLVAVYDRRIHNVIAAVAGDIFLDRLYWASQGGYAECLDFISHSWFRLDGGMEPKSSLSGARINVLTTKVDRYRALSYQTELMNAIHEANGRVNLSWGSSTVIYHPQSGWLDEGPPRGPSVNERG
jgi:hypothetical protein